MSDPRALRHSAAATLLAPILEAGRGPTGWELVSWDDEQGISVTLAFRGSLLLIELEGRDEHRPCYARTERFNVSVRHAFDFGRVLAPAERHIVRGVLDVVRAREGLLPSFERPVTAQRSLVRVLEVDRVLVPEGAGHYYLNPYVGCTIGCSFCYVSHRADLSRSLEGLPRLEWGRYVDVKHNAAAILRAETRLHPPGPVRLSPILTDPYQPVERKYRITRQCLEVLLEAGFAPVVLTRAARVVEDLALLGRFPHAAVGLSIPTDDDAVRRAFEPGADAIADRLAALAELHAAGIRTFAVVQPVLPMDVAALVAAVAPHVHAVRIDRMYELERARPLYEAAGRLDAATEAFFATTEAALRAAFGARGVVVDELDDMASLLGLSPPRGGGRAPGGGDPGGATLAP